MPFFCFRVVSGTTVSHRPIITPVQSVLCLGPTHNGSLRSRTLPSPIVHWTTPTAWVDFACHCPFVVASDGDQVSLVELHKCLAVARRARGDMSGAREALVKVEALASEGGGGGADDVEELNRMLGSNRIVVD